MTPIEALPHFRHYAAPRQHGTALIDPPLKSMGQLIEDNLRSAKDWDVQIAGQPIAELRKRAKRELLVAAIQHTEAYREVPAAWKKKAALWLAASPTQLATKRSLSENFSPRQSMGALPEFILAGHQPELFHPGVWFKNFALSAIARRRAAVAINLVVDNDLCGATSVRVPSLRSGHLASSTVAFDQPLAQIIPFEQRWIRDRETFDAFPRRLVEQLAGLVDEPAVLRLWPLAQQAADHCANVGCSLAQARHALEGELGLQTLELPLSSACRSYAFAAFILNLLAELPRLHQCYNESLREYRLAHRIRSQAHPVPRLDQADGWFEIPLWIYGDQDPRRQPAWARLIGDQLEIGDRDQRHLMITAELNSEAAVEQLLAGMGHNFKLRPRALMTTMYARLILSDLFLHGIGGAKYDQLGDMIVRRFFNIQPPAYAVLSATVLLPVGEQSAGHRSVAEVIADLRRVEYAPERFTHLVNLPAELLRRKQALLADIPPRAFKAAWHQELQQLNQRLATHLSSVEQSLRHELAIAKADAREHQIRLSREHPFPAYPLDYLRQAFQALISDPEGE